MRVRFLLGERQIEDLPPRSVALDGVVQGPRMGDDQDRWSFDHHAGCVRLVTQATCEQVWTATMLGFKWRDRDVWVNDLDGDTVIALYVIKCALDSAPMPKKLGALVRVVGLVDAHGPSADVLMTDEEKALANAFYRGVIYPILGRNVQERFDEWHDLLNECHNGIDKVLSGDVDLPEPDPVEPTVKHKGYAGDLSVVLARCSGSGGFAHFYKQGYDVVILSDSAANGTRRYTIGKVSDLVPFDLQELLRRLNNIEKGWGGGSTIGGSPRGDNGESSRLDEMRVFCIAIDVAEGLDEVIYS